METATVVPPAPPEITTCSSKFEACHLRFGAEQGLELVGVLFVRLCSSTRTAASYP